MNLSSEQNRNEIRYLLVNATARRDAAAHAAVSFCVDAARQRLVSHNVYVASTSVVGVVQCDVTEAVKRDHAVTELPTSPPTG
jgi:hypothetical protein